MNKTKINFFWSNPPRETPAPFHYKTVASFYASPAWERLRLFKLSISPLCERCSNQDRAVPAIEVHHKTDIADNPNLALEIENLESLCKKCHSQETIKKLQASKRPQGGGIITIKSKVLQNEQEIRENKGRGDQGSPGSPGSPGRRDPSDVRSGEDPRELR